ncbi:MAG: hypothetical protein AABX98_05055 [Nanoarchaeota archaeon]
MKNQIKARVIIEMLGAPKEHIEETLKLYIEKIKTQEKDIVVRNIEYGDPKEVDTLFSVFAELELDFTNMKTLTYFCFDYMPSSIEVFEPSEFSYTANDYTDFLNDLQARLHKFDMLIKNLSAENKVIKKNGLTLARNTVLACVESGPKTLLEISKRSGMPEEHIKKFVNILVKEEKIKEKDGKYSL